MRKSPGKNISRSVFSRMPMGATSSVCHDMSMANRFLMDANVSRCVTPKVNRTAHIDEKALHSRDLFLSDLFSVVFEDCNNCHAYSYSEFDLGTMNQSWAHESADFGQPILKYANGFRATPAKYDATKKVTSALNPLSTEKRGEWFGTSEDQNSGLYQSLRGNRIIRSGYR